MAKFNGNEVKLYAEISGGGGSDVFNVEYGVTTFAEIKAAYDSGKQIQLQRQESDGVRIYSLSNIKEQSIGNSAALFSCIWNNTVYRAVVGDDGVWGNYSFDLMIESDGQFVGILDEGNYFTNDTVEGALQEIGAKLATIAAQLGIQ